MDDPIEKLQNIDSEIVIGLVGALGTDLARVRDLVTEALVRIRYDVIPIKISKEVIPFFGEIEYEEGNESDRVEKMMDAGNRARESSKDRSVLALGAASVIASRRDLDRRPFTRTAFIIDSLKRPEEVARLRKIHPGGFVLLGVHANEERRLAKLESHGMTKEKAQQLVDRDSNDKSREFAGSDAAIDLP